MAMMTGGGTHELLGATVEQAAIKFGLGWAKAQFPETWQTQIVVGKVVGYLCQGTNSQKPFLVEWLDLDTESMSESYLRSLHPASGPSDEIPPAQEGAAILSDFRERCEC